MSELVLKKKGEFGFEVFWGDEHVCDIKKVERTETISTYNTTISSWTPPRHVRKTHYRLEEKIPLSLRIKEYPNFLGALEYLEEALQRRFAPKVSLWRSILENSNLSPEALEGALKMVGEAERVLAVAVVDSQRFFLQQKPMSAEALCREARYFFHDKKIHELSVFYKDGTENLIQPSEYSYTLVKKDGGKVQ